MVPLAREQEQEAVALLVELLLDAAVRKTPGVHFSRRFRGAIGGVIPFPEPRA